MSLAPSISVFRHQGFRHYFIFRVLVAGARQMEAVAIGFLVYDLARLTRGVEESALLLGLVGLTQFLPVLLFSLVGGQAADRLNRKAILLVSNGIRVIASLVLVYAALMPGDAGLPVIFIVSAILGTVNAFTPAAANALFPQLVPRNDLSLAISWSSLGFQIAAITGPAIGGLLYAVSPATVFAIASVMIAGALVSMATAETPAHQKVSEARGWSMVIEGLRYVGHNKIVLGAISLDLVVVFFAGAVALLPVFARDILFVDDWALGVLRAAPAAGAALVALALATRPLTRRVGLWMFGAVFVFGLAILVFGLSTSLWLSLIALAVHGAGDMISVYVRQSLVQLSTPDAMRGRVTSVSFIFIAASNELGEFQSGIAARLLGPVGAVLFGGIFALGATFAWMGLFPQLRRADRFEAIEEQKITPS